MLTDADEGTARTLMVELEQFRSVFLQFMGEEPEIPMQVTVVYFASDRDFDRYKPQYQGKMKSVAGFFTGSSINGFMAIGRGPNFTETKRIIYHEYVHALYHELGWRPPLWLNEGTAEVFSTYAIRRGAAELGSAPESHVQLLRNRQLVPLERLLSVGHDSPDYNEQFRQGMFYAESWALAHFLICNSDPTWRARLNAFLPRLTSGPLSEADFRAALGVSFAQMEGLLNDYIYGGRYTIFKFPVPQAEIAAKIRVRPAQPAERDLTLQLLAALSRDSTTADYQLLVLLEKFPTSARVCEAIATRAMNAGDVEKAWDYLRRAVERGTQNTRVYWLLGDELRRRWLTTDMGPNKRLGSIVAADLRAMLGRVVQDDPTAVDAWEALARTEAFAPEPDPRTVERICALSEQRPDDPRLWQARMLAGFAYKRLGETERAREIGSQVDAAKAVSPGTRRFNRLLLGDLLPPAGVATGQ